MEETRMVCINLSCEKRSWTLGDHRIAASHSLLTTRAAKWATKQVGGGRCVSEVAKELPQAQQPATTN